MKAFWLLFRARNREFYRDKGSLGWALAVPLTIILAVGFASPDAEPALFKVGVLGASAAELPDWPFLAADHTEILRLSDRERALRKLRHHQYDMVVRAGPAPEFWINRESSRGELLASLARPAGPAARPRPDGAPASRYVSGQPLRYIDWAIPGILGMTIMFTALFGAGYVIVRYRKNGVLKRLMATPVTAIQFLAAQMASRLVIIAASNATVYAASAQLLGFVMLGSHWLLLALGLLGGCALVSLAMLFASRSDSEELAGGMLNFATFPMLLLSEVWFSLDGAPAWMHWLSQALPLTHLVRAARAVMLDGAGFAAVWPQVAALAAMSAAFLGLAAALFRWHRV